MVRRRSRRGEVEGLAARRQPDDAGRAVQRLDLALTTFDTMVGDGVKAIAIVVPDKALGPVVAEKAAKAGIKLIAVDDDIYTAEKKMVPYIGMIAEEIGKQVGAEEARLYKAMGWDKFNDVRIGSVEDQKADTCMRRNRGAEAAFFEACRASTRRISSISPTTTRWRARSRT